MRYDYTALNNTATQLIKKFGAEYGFERQCNRDYDPETGKPVKKVIKYTANGVVVQFDSTQRNGENVQQGDIRLLAESEEYEIGDLLNINCIPHRIIDISTIQGSEKKLAYYLHLRL